MVISIKLIYQTVRPMLQNIHYKFEIFAGIDSCINHSSRAKVLEQVFLSAILSPSGCR